MPMRFLLCTFVALQTLPGCASPPAADPDEALASWEHEDQAAEYETLKAYAEVVRQGVTRGDSQTFGRLLSIARSERHNLSSRMLAMSVACQAADDVSGLLVLELIKDFDAGRMIPPDVTDDAEKKKIRNSHMAVVGGFVEKDMKNLLEAMEDHMPVFTFLKDYFLGSASRSMRWKTAELMAACEIPQATRREAIVEMIDRCKKRRRIVPESLVELLGPAAYPALRELVRAETSRPKFHFSAARALSLLGDEEIIPDLEALRPTFLAESRNIETILIMCIWRIKIQHPPAKLLEYIASTDLPGKREWRMWALRRAHKLGLDPSSIREAILTHARNGKTRIERVELPDLKHWGQKMGILQQDDLPDVEVHRGGRLP